jgi:histidinol-phosphate aminotransferase
MNYYRKKDIFFTSYSEVVSASLRKKIGQTYGFKPTEILLGAGVSDLLHLCHVTFINPGEDIVMPETTFPPIEFLAILAHGHPKFVPLTPELGLDYDRFSKIISPTTKLAVLCNPNNPTGKQLDLKKIQQLIQQHPKTIFLIDEANIDFGATRSSNLPKKPKTYWFCGHFPKASGWLDCASVL